MPLPDADPDKRMYKLLKNIDLENLSFAQFQSTAQTVFAEPESEDTLRRIVLINLSRMAVAGDWNGLTTAASSGAPGLKIVTSTMSGGSYDQFNTADAPPYGASSASGSFEQTPFVDNLFLWPFQAQTTGTVSSLGMKFETAGAYEVVIYDVDSENLPNLLIVKGTMTASGAETVYQTSLTGFGGGAAGSITVGETYFLGMVQVTGLPKIMCATYLNRARCASTNAPGTAGGTLLRTPTYTASTGVPDTVDNTYTYPSSGACPKVSYEV